MGSISRLGRPLEEENGNLLQYSLLENSMERRAWHAIVHGLTELDTTQCARAHTHTHTHTHNLMKATQLSIIE